MAPPAKKARPQTAYFVFAELHRAKVREDLLLLGEEGANVSVATVAKALGEKWAGLSEQEKATYKDIAQQRAQEAQAAAAAQAEQAGGEGGADPGGADAAGAAADERPALPRGIVRRIMTADPETGRVSADAVWCAGRAAELFMELLAVRAAGVAAGKRRGTVKLEDVDQVVRHDKRLVELGLKEVVADADMYAAAHVAKPRSGGGGGRAAGATAGEDAHMADGDGEGAAGKGGAAAAAKHVGRPPGKAKAAGAAKNTHSITTFFVRAPAVS